MTPDDIRRKFIAILPQVRVISADETIAIDPTCDVWLVLALASWLISQWPEDTPYDLALNNLALATAALLIAPGTDALDAWHQARAEHAALLLPA
jgi:hypothetical protein